LVFDMVLSWGCGAKENASNALSYSRLGAVSNEPMFSFGSNGLRRKER
jgi:hypothetical protein